MRRLITFLFTLLMFGISACATPQISTLISVPYSPDIKLHQVKWEEGKVILQVADTWKVEYADSLIDNFYVQGPPRTNGQACFHLVYSEQYKHSLGDLAQSAAMIAGVQIPAPSAPVAIAGLNGRQSGGISSLNHQNVVAYAWKRNGRVYLLTLTWIEEQDGQALGAMMKSIELFE